MGAGILSNQKVRVNQFIKTKIFCGFLFFLCFSQGSYPDELPSPLKFCSREVILATPGQFKNHWLADFDLFERQCKKGCKKYAANIISAWAFTNGYSKIEEPVCLFGVGKPENNNQFSVLILFPERVFDIIQPDPNRTLPARLLGPGKFGASFDFQLKPLQVLAQDDLSLGPNSEKIECFEINFGNPIEFEDPNLFEKFIGKGIFINIIFNRKGGVQKWFSEGGMDLKTKGEWKIEGLQKKIQFLGKTKIKFSDTVKPFLGFGFFVSCDIVFLKNAEGNPQIQIDYECGKNRRKQTFVIKPRSEMEWKVGDFKPPVEVQKIQ